MYNSSSKKFTYHINFFSLGQIVVGGVTYEEQDEQQGITSMFNKPLSSVQLFPHPSSEACFIPDLPQPRVGHTLSLLSGERVVVCGGGSTHYSQFFNNCISWIWGNRSWTPLFTTRCIQRKKLLAPKVLLDYDIHLGVGDK